MKIPPKTQDEMNVGYVPMTTKPAIKVSTHIKDNVCLKST